MRVRERERALRARDIDEAWGVSAVAVPSSHAHPPSLPSRRPALLASSGTGGEEKKSAADKLLFYADAGRKHVAANTR